MYMSDYLGALSLFKWSPLLIGRWHNALQPLPQVCELVNHYINAVDHNVCFNPVDMETQKFSQSVYMAHI